MYYCESEDEEGPDLGRSASRLVTHLTEERVYEEGKLLRLAAQCGSRAAIMRSSGEEDG